MTIRHKLALVVLVTASCTDSQSVNWVAESQITAPEAEPAGVSKAQRKALAHVGLTERFDLRTLAERAPGQGEQKRRILLQELSSLIPNADERKLTVGYLTDSGGRFTAHRDPAVAAVVTEYYRERDLDRASEALGASRQWAKTYPISVTVGYSSRIFAGSRAIVVRHPAKPGRAVVLLPRGANAQDVATAFRVLYELRVSLGDFVPARMETAVRGSTKANADQLDRYGQLLLELNEGSRVIVWGDTLESATTTRLGHIRNPRAKSVILP